MADIELVIKIPEEEYKCVQITGHIGNVTQVSNAIFTGKPIPKGHGRLIDADEALKAMDTWDKFGFEHTGLFVRNPEDDFIKYVHYDDMVKSVRGAETIIEADKE